MNPTQYAILGYVVSFGLFGGFALWSWFEYRRLARRRERRSRS